MERIQQAIKEILEDNLPGQLDAREVITGYPTVGLPDPQVYLLNFDEGFTVVRANQYPALILLPGRTRVDHVLTTGTVLDQFHELAIVCLIIDQDADTLHRKRVRYAEAIVEALMDNFKAKPPIISVKITNVAYDRTLRDEAQAAYLSSVWVVLEVRERVTY